MTKTLLLNANIVNESRTIEADVLIDGNRIERVDSDLSSLSANKVVDLSGLTLLPGVIDDQVHFRQPGLTHKADIFTESRAAVAGGITSYMEMPNTVPNTLTQELLEEKYALGSQNSLANYSFYMGASNNNLDEVLRTDISKVCGVKIFMGSSTGNMLVDNHDTLESIFSNSPALIATHCEDEATIQANTKLYRDKYGETMPFRYHPQIRSEQACYLSSSMAVDLAKKTGARLHVLHISTEKELALFNSKSPLSQKLITSEACIHHMWFSDEDYDAKGSMIKWNPAVKTKQDRDAILNAVIADTIDVIATDHAPHTLKEKKNGYFDAPSGGPLVQHSLVAMLDHYHNGKISLERIVDKMCHNPAILFRIKDRGYIREGYYADLTAVDLQNPWSVDSSNILAKCGWSPFEGHQFQSKVIHTWVSGHHAFENGQLMEGRSGMRLVFDTLNK